MPRQRTRAETCARLISMCGRYRLTKRRMLEIEDYYGVDDMIDLEMWKREFNIPPRKWLLLSWKLTESAA